MAPKKPAGAPKVPSTKKQAPAKVEGSGQATEGDSAAEPPATSTPTATPSGTPASTPAPPIRAGSSAQPSPAPRGRGAAPKPKFAGRRSATARAELEAAEAKKKEAEAKAAAEEAKRNAKEARKFGYNARGRGSGAPRGGRGRGGHMGDTNRRQQESVASGPFSAGQAGADQRSGWSRSVGGRGGGGGGSASGAFGGGYVTGGAPGSHSSSRPGVSYTSGGTSIKAEAGSGDITMSGMRSIKTEDGGYISSDEDEVQGVPRRDVDQMQVIDLTGDNGPEEKDPFFPVRLARVAHKDRTIGLAAEDSPETSDAAEVVSEKRKGKQRSKDVEVTRTKSLPKRPTVYSSSDTEGETQVKKEPADDEHQTRPVTPELPSAEEATVISPSRDLPSSPESRRKAKEKIKSAVDAFAGNDSDFEIPPVPRFQTQAEKDEWDRHYDDLRQIRAEFGRQVPKQHDADGDTAMAETTPALERAKEQERVRAEHVYLFQFPPVLPDLKPITIKEDPEATTEDANGEAMEVDPPQDGLCAVTKPDPASKSTQPKLPSGQVGKFRVHRSGKTTLDWGGTSFVLGKGADATFLQNVLIAKVPETKPKENDKAPAADQEEAIGLGMGIVRGKFVLTPNWDEILR